MANVKIKKTAAEVRAMQSNEKSSSLKFVEFLAKNKILLSLVLIVLLGAGVFAVFYSNNLSKKNEEAAFLLDYSTMIVNQLPYQTNREGMQKAYQQLQGNLSKLINEYPDSVAAIRGRFLMGRMMLESAQAQAGAMNNEADQILNKALEYYTEAYDYAKNDHYKVLSLYGMGMCHEHKRAPREAALKYQEIINKYPKSPLVPTAIIALAKMKFALGDANGAKVLCDGLVKQYPDSEWSQYAQGMVYMFKSGLGRRKIMTPKKKKAVTSPIDQLTPLTPIQ